MNDVVPEARLSPCSTCQFARLSCWFSHGLETPGLECGIVKSSRREVGTADRFPAFTSSVWSPLLAGEPCFRLRQLVRPRKIKAYNASQAIGCIPSRIDVSAAIENQ